MNQIDEVRLDKWLWAARFFKTRHLAVEAINGGKVQVNGSRAKPGRDIRPGMQVSIHKGSLVWEVQVLAVSQQRRPAAEAAQLYLEDAASRTRREELLLRQREAGPQDTFGERPTKRDRRQFERFTMDQGG
ncbi:S4 domain-containing protein [uncultured Thiodictyon sp.]|uniref:RNA-binding S4 domain-containing protein n=1 Tax=uncultured Thiodictyon sp. TaxID=1846217 RepID=UPI0025EA1117|nr:S4 domain-containing protein [uncultured Thiodictyon sp.]